MSHPPYRICFALVVLALVAFQDQAVAEAEALTNEEIVKIVQLGFSDDIVIAKIKQAPQVNFSLETENLVKLRESHVSSQVIAAMLDRATAKPVPQPGAASGLAIASALGMEMSEVKLVTSAGEFPLTLVRGEMGSTTVMGFGALFMNFPGVSSRMRTADPRAVLILTSKAPPANRFFIGRLDADEDDGVRSLKLMSARRALRIVQKSQNRMDPDPDWTVPYDAVEISPGLWRLTPKEDLKGGEYGLYVDFGVSMQGSGLFDFGVD